MKIRIRFEKEGAIRFIGHLDIMRYFHKALQRAHVDVSFSTGYHPHPIMSFASPLGVGLTSCGEYMDVEVGTLEDGDEMMRRINEQMTEGIRVTGIRVLPDEGRKNNAMATVGLADYDVWLQNCEEHPETEEVMARRNLAEDVERFLAKEQILITKKTKKSEKEVNIRSWILSMYVDQRNHFIMRLTAGSMNNLKPELVMEAFLDFLGLPYCRRMVGICRLDMLTEDGTSLGALGTEMKAHE